jgi:hypothetical protein
MPQHAHCQWLDGQYCCRPTNQTLVDRCDRVSLPIEIYGKNLCDCVNICAILHQQRHRGDMPTIYCVMQRCPSILYSPERAVRYTATPKRPQKWGDLRRQLLPPQRHARSGIRLLCLFLPMHSRGAPSFLPVIDKVSSEESRSTLFNTHRNLLPSTLNGRPHHAQ